MKIFVAIIMLFVGIAFAEEAATTINVNAGKKFTITLDSNPTTGYQWQIAEPIDENLIKFVRSKYMSPKTSLVGAGGQEEWIFKAIGKGKTTISFKYIRVWEKGIPPVKTQRFTVIVK